MKTSVRIVGVPAEFRTRHRPNASQKRHRLSHPALRFVEKILLADRRLRRCKVNNETKFVAGNLCNLFSRQALYCSTKFLLRALK
jgi:hypothetical protein